MSRRKDDRLNPDVAIHNNGGKYRLVISGSLYRDGKRRYLSLGIPVDSVDARLKAIAKQAQLQIEINAKTFDPTLKKYSDWRWEWEREKYVIPDKFTLGKLWEMWCEYRRRLVAESTYQKKFKGTFYRMLTKIGLHLEITHQTAFRVRNYLLDNLNRADTIWLIRELEKAVNFAIANKEYTDTNPFLGIADEVQKSRNKRVSAKSADELTNNNKDKIAFTKDEIKSILSYFWKRYPEYYDFVYFRFYTACRFGESIELRWNDITSDCRYIIFRRSYDTDSATIKATKTGKERKFKCSEELQELLLRRKEELLPKAQDLVFTNPQGDRINVRGFAKLWERAMLRLSESGEISVVLSPKHTRHTFVSLARQAGYDPIAIADQVGHSKAVADEHYLQKNGELVLNLE